MSASRPTRIKSAPASANACAIARPSPRLPPVISAVRPFKPESIQNTHVDFHCRRGVSLAAPMVTI